MDYNINDNWSIAILVAIIIIFLIFKLYESLNDSEASKSEIITTKNIL